MAKITVKDAIIRTVKVNDIDYICITDIARQKNPLEPKDVVKNWLRSKNTLEYLGLWEMLNNPDFKGVEFDPLIKEAGSNAFTMSPSRWIETTNAIGRSRAETPRLVGKTRTLKVELSHPHRCNKAELNSARADGQAEIFCLCRRG